MYRCDGTAKSVTLINVTLENIMKVWLIVCNLYEKTGRYWRTVRHLRFIQIFNRIARKVRLCPRVSTIVPRVSQFRHKIKWINKRQSIYGVSEFFFLNKKLKLNFPNDWENQQLPLLWMYNLHYFDGLLSLDTPELLKEKVLSNWIRDNSRICGIAWEPYPTSLRIVNWIKWRWTSRIEDIERFDNTLACQLNYLYNAIEYHLLGNHLLENAKALIFGGSYFEGSDAVRWLNKGLEILDQELSEQILKDGGHFELSPMYHSIMLELVLDLLALASLGDAPISLRSRKPMLSATATKMNDWLRVMTHPDGEISFFNDASTNIALPPNVLEDYLNTLEEKVGKSNTLPITHLSSSGYVRMECKSSVLFADVAEIGPTYLPGHGHADALSIEFSLFGHRLFVNLGTSEYGDGARRHFERSTAAHSTMELNRENSSETWSGFRVGRRAKVSGLNIKSTESQCELIAQHNGYRYLSGRPVHSRRVICSEGDLVIIDEINQNNYIGSVRFHIHPSIKLVIAKTGISGSFLFPDGSEAVWKSDTDQVSVENNEYAWEFGKKIPIKTLVLHQTKRNKSIFKVKWICH
jgi:uncharacterized heparinase superfamily protein